jgi:WD40 repeat protein
MYRLLTPRSPSLPLAGLLALLLAGGWGPPMGRARAGDRAPARQRWRVAKVLIKDQEQFAAPCLGTACVKFAPDGKSLAVVDDGGVRFINLGTELTRKWEQATDVRCLAYDVTGQFVALGLGSSDAHQPHDRKGAGACILDAKDRYRPYLKDLARDDGLEVYSVAFAPGRKPMTLALGREDGSILLYQIEDRDNFEKAASVQRHRGTVRSLAFSPDGKTLASLGQDGTAILWEVGKGGLKEKETLELYDDDSQGQPTDIKGPRPDGLAFAPDGRVLATCGRSSAGGKWWDVTGQAPAEKAAPEFSGLVPALAFSPGGKLFVTAVGDTLQWWDVGTRKLLHSRGGEGGPGWVISLAFAPDGKTMATINKKGGVKLWQAEKE